MFQRIEEILHGIPGQVGCYIYYPATGERFAYQADMPLVAASVIKLPILVEAFRQREAEARQQDEALAQQEKAAREQKRKEELLLRQQQQQAGR